jgi:hypothetical protein
MIFRRSSWESSGRTGREGQEVAASTVREGRNEGIKEDN